MKRPPLIVIRQATGKYVSDFMRTARKLAAALAKVNR